MWSLLFPLASLNHVYCEFVLKRRGAIKASITKLITKVTDLEAQEPGPTTLTHAQQLTKRLENLDSDFKTRHFAIINVIEDDEQLAEEQDVLNQHEDELAMILTPSPTPTSDTHSRAIMERQLQARLVSTHDKIGDLKDDGSE